MAEIDPPSADSVKSPQTTIDTEDVEEDVSVSNCIYDCDKIEKYVDEEGKRCWKCLWCNRVYSGWNATKALAHVSRISGMHVGVCVAKIEDSYRLKYSKLLNRISMRRRSRNQFNEVLSLSYDQHNNTTASIHNSSKKRQKQVPESVVTTVSKASEPKERIHLTLTGEKNPMAESKLTMAIAHFIHCSALPFSTTQDPNFRKCITLARAVGSEYKFPSRNQVAGPLLDLNYEQIMETERKELLKSANEYGITLLGDGATVKRLPLTNVLASTPTKPVCVLEIADATEHIANGGSKNARYVASLFLPYIEEFEKMYPGSCDVLFFDGAGNVQKAGDVVSASYPRIITLHGAEHVMSLWFKDLFMQKYLKAVFSIIQRIYNVFGSGARHGPYAIMCKYAKIHNKGRNIGFIKEAGNRMGGCFIATQRVVRQKAALLETVNSIEFSQLKVATGLKNVLNSDLFWEDLITILRACYAGLHVLRLADKKEPAMDKLYYYVRRMDKLTNEYREVLNAMEKRYLESDGSTPLAQIINYFVVSKEKAADTNNEFQKHMREEEDEVRKKEAESSSDEMWEEDSRHKVELDAGGAVQGTGLGDIYYRAWKHRREKLEHELSVAAWYVCPCPEVMADVKENANGTHQDMVTALLLRWYGQDKSKKEKNDLINKFWTEHEQFASKSGHAYEGRDYIWDHSDIRNGNSYRWHKMFTLNTTEILGKYATRLTSKILGIGSAERSWGDVKDNKIGKRSHLSGDRTKKQSTIYGQDCMKKAELKRRMVKDDIPFKFWQDEDFDDALDHFVEGVNKQAERVLQRIFRTFEEQWEQEAIRKKDPVHEAKLLKKYGGLRLWDPDENVECTTSTTELRWSRPTKRGGGYMILVFDENYVEGADDEDEHYAPWEINDDLRACILDHYTRNEDKRVILLTEEEEHDTESDKSDTDEEDDDALLETKAISK